MIRSEPPWRPSEKPFEIWSILVLPIGPTDQIGGWLGTQLR